MAEIIEMPKLGFDMAEGTLVKWLKDEGEKIEKGDMLADIETDKATLQVESSASGVVLKHLVEANTTVPIASPIAVIATEGEQVDLEQLLGGKALPAAKAAQPQESQPIPSAPAPGSTAASASVSQESGFIKASPVAKAIAADKAVNLAALNGSGPGGRIVKRDVEAALQSGSASQAVQSSPAPGMPAPAQAQIIPGQDTRISISRLRGAIGKRMQESNQNIPHFFLTRSYDVGSLMQMRKQMNEGRDKGNKVSVNDFVVRAIALALRQFPNINASISEQEIIQHGNINVGVAVALDNGLLTVVVKNADQKDLDQIGWETGQLSQRARDGKLRNEDIEGSTFTISNLGMYGIEEFSAIVNPPEAAILAVGSAQQVPVVEDGALKTGWRMKATLSADHRITDGAEAARFMQHLALYLEQPWRLV
ncbi:dihydrolipoamide acetyltransferase family protein [Pelolinea submarina]|uniref:Dihydrolipoamide acetyltransferase component of pyruvate dehydrogenase complex n=1 Tax=Pelolinea submarina TaxID=913107 RepID=A0A347ZWB2_9CHLR|nr:dihydrolipoamide acetyltransferase family protein [Pelolinea submarina]REG07292.1 pyruvate dehydrogenase E2 component (dihydrolipoamide acetyltransferase) [Pelolinea submarina]BBB49593.1 pyruvate dehydrogenase E2 component, dihydrolipoamide acetyltransferase [Pelolinea submarina]